MLKNSMGKISNIPEERDFNREIKPIKKKDPKRSTRNRKKIRIKNQFDDLVSRLDREKKIS